MVFEDGKHYCVRCTSKEKHYVYFKSDVFDCLVCGAKLIDHEPTGMEIADHRSKVQTLSDSGKELCPQCNAVYPLGDFITCPNCWSLKNPDQDFDPIMKSKQPKGEVL